MKPLFKRITLIILLLLLATLNACTNNLDEASNDLEPSPVIMGAINLTIDIGAKFDPLEGITATWNDIDLTEMIEITGYVNVDEAGDYILTYTVSNELGQQALVNRTIKVIESNQTPIDSRFTIADEYNQNHHQMMHTQANGYIKNDQDVTTYQEVNVFTQGSDVLVANWSKFSGGKYVKASTIDIAKDFELNHPNYEVIAAVNGDFFWTETISANVIFGHRTIKPENDWQGFYQQVQFNAYGEKIDVLKRTSISNSMYISLYDVDGGLNYYDYRVSFNSSQLKENETTIVFSGTHHPYDSDATYFAISQKNLHHVGSHVYFEGTIQQPLMQIDSNKIMIATKNPDLKSLLETNQRVIVQHVVNEIGYNDMLMGIDAPIISDNYVKTFSELNTETQEQISRNTGRHPRTGFGFDNTGRMVLITVDGRGTSRGVDLIEFAHIMKHYGIVEGYNLDGGGSTQAVLKQEGEFTYVNTPSENNRQVGNAILLIREKNLRPNYELNFTNEEVTFKLLDTAQIDELIIKVNGVSQRYANVNDLIRLNLKKDVINAISISYLKDSKIYVLRNEVVDHQREQIPLIVDIGGETFNAKLNFNFASNIGGSRDVIIFTKERWQEISAIVDVPQYNLTDYKMANMVLAVTDKQGKVVMIRTYWKWSQPQYGFQFLKDDDGDIILQKEAFNRNNLEIGVNEMIPDGGYVFIFPTDLAYVDAVQFGTNQLLGLDWDLQLGLILKGETTSYADWKNLPVNPFDDNFRIFWTGMNAD